MLAGVFGVAYFVYGKRQARLVPMVCGVALCVYPYFFESVLWLAVIGLALLAAPFVIDY
jgi:predicted cobalt transporter CbtA